MNTEELGVTFSASDKGVRMYVVDKDMNVGLHIDFNPTQAALVASSLLGEIGKIGKSMG